MKLQAPQFSILLKDYSKFKSSKLYGRYLKEDDVLQNLRSLSYKFKIKNEGCSEEGRIITSFHLGKGKTKILIWSQMHGNETTTTKSVFDLLNYLNLNDEFTKELFEKCRLIIIPVLNPDGAVNYTRVNSNGVDLNRDAFQKTQAESKVLQTIYSNFKPDVCFNMHDQRTIFSAGKTNKPATLSFLSPSFNETRDINQIRKKSMSLISSANQLLQKFIPGQIGRYDDGFNINCIGDFFQKNGTPTVLFEAGHFPSDYEREETRKYIFISLLNMIIDVVNDEELKSTNEYFAIPENDKLYYDLIIKNILKGNRTLDLAVQYQETLIDDKIEFIPFIEKIDNLELFYGHRVIDAQNQSLKFKKHTTLKEGEILSSFKLNDNDFVM
ncbi:M14 family zinc carboxypeptidase [Psychroflexus salinarum]|uniref:M14 family zinc carboxypeptidase n=1 Tax=Psychroflexus salinarum TaxID=546024 RepID=A0ABW3GUX1_9FLAO